MKFHKRNIVFLLILILGISVGVFSPAFAASKKIKKISCASGPVKVFSATVTIEPNTDPGYPAKHDGTYPLSSLEGSFETLRSAVDLGCGMRLVLEGSGQSSSFLCKTAHAATGGFSCHLGTAERQTAIIGSKEKNVTAPRFQIEQNEVWNLWTMGLFTDGTLGYFIPETFVGGPGKGKVTIFAVQ